MFVLRIRDISLLRVFRDIMSVMVSCAMAGAAFYQSHCHLPSLLNAPGMLFPPLLSFAASGAGGSWATPAACGDSMHPPGLSASHGRISPRRFHLIPNQQIGAYLRAATPLESFRAPLPSVPSLNCVLAAPYFFRKGGTQ